MNNKIARYLFVDSRNMTKTIFELRQELICNDKVNIFEKDTIVSASKIFKKNNVPKDFRKIIIKLNRIITPSNSNNVKSYEFLSAKPIDLSVCKKESVRTFKGTNKVNEDLCDWFLAPLNNFIVNDKTYSYESVIEFFKKMKENGCLEDYLKSIYEIFNLSYHLHFMYEENLKESKKFVLQIK